MKLKNKYILILFSFLFIQVGIAQKVTWTDISVPGWEGGFNRVAISKGGRIITASDLGWLYQSIDTGKTWNPTFNFNHNSKITVYEGNCNIVVKSLDFSSDSLHGIVVAENDSLVNNFPTVFTSLLSYTADGGKTWQNTQTDFTHYLLRGLCWKTKDSAFIVTHNQVTFKTSVYVTSNSGKTWTQTIGNINDPLLQYYGISDYQIYFASPKHGYALSQGSYGETNDGGMNWSRIVLPKLNPKLKFQFSNSQILIATDTIRSSISFPNCHFINIPNNYNIAPKQITDLGNGKLLSIGATTNTNEFQSSNDSGQTWSTKIINFHQSAKNYPLGISFLNANNGIMLFGYNTLFTNDSGNSWTSYFYGTNGVGNTPIYCNTKNNCLMLSSNGRIYHSTDGCLSWNFQDIDTIELKHIQFPTKDTGYISGNYTFYKTIDAGQHWTKSDLVNNGDYLQFITKDIGFTGASGSWGEYYNSITTDGSNTWNTMWGDTVYDNAFGVGGGFFKTQNEGLVGGTTSLLYTSDGGTTFQRKASEILVGTSSISIYSTKNNWLLLGKNKKGNSIYLCDKDVNCKQVYTSTINVASNFLQPDSNTLFVLSTGDSCIISKDNGTTWNKEYFPNPGGILSFGDSKTVYSIISEPVTLYKGIIQTPTTVSLTQTGNRTISCTVVTNPPSSFPASIVLMKNDSVYYQSSVTIQSGTAFTITIPSSIAAGSDYSIKLIPTDTITYAPAQSSVFSIATAVPIIGNSPVIRVVDKSIVCDCTNFTVYNYLGQKMYPTNLPIGFYFVQVGNSVQKVIIKE